ncbi:gliding motility protein [Chryseobacterium sp. Leaf404]|uniref:choice-of-anchor L domain-containing protein n=1 Tax=unclassified Chryseobacterium TaxID=2593645 RepID=UPI0006FFA787|nr:MULTISPECIES: choice-of-anchor L domain-containing protein [unclassified Chryseobacterium]KQT16826.1 gliding motility protein [Chryseobacterium sp. Leaf404]
MIIKSTRNLFLTLLTILSSTVLFSQDRSKQILKQPTSQTMKAGAFIDINTSNYPQSSFSITQLITNVLIAGNTNCTTPNVSNVVVSPNLAVSDPNRSWGYFNKGATNFPFSNGIVLTTGYAARAGNTFQPGQLSNALPSQGDADLAAALNLPPGALKDASFIEFDFVPTANQVSFRYLFASEEYEGNFPCTITDGFALLLRPASGGAYTNLAVLPGGAGPVSVTNIIPGTYNCGPKNAQYFGGQNTANIETNFSGRTVPLTATATVVAGQAYHFKMVLADYQDSAYDSGVFLEAGSFDIGVQILGSNGVQLPASINVCDNAPQTFTASVQNPNATYQWFLNNVAIPGATNATYTAIQPGVYKVEVLFPGSSCPGTATVTIVGGTTPTTQNATLTACYAQGNAIFNLNNANTAISTTPGATFTYYVNQADAVAGNANNIQTPTVYPSPGNQTVYVLVKNGFCSKVAQLQLVKAPEITANVAAPPVLTCTNSQITLNGSASVYPAGSTFAWTTTGGNIVSGGNTLNPVINASGTYTLTISNTYQPGNLTCTSVSTVTVTGDSAPPSPTLTASKMQICSGETVTLTAGGGVTYTWSTLPGTGNTQTVSPTTTTTYSVTAVGANGCPSANPATVTVEVSQPITVQNATLLKCYSAAGIVYDLTAAQSQITSATGATFAYYLLQADANQGNNNTIGTPTTFSSAGNQTIYVLVKNGACSYVVTLQLQTTAVTTLSIAAPATITCTTPQITLNATASTVPAGSTINWTTTGGNIVSGGNTLTPIVNAGGAYTLTVSNTTQPGNLTCTYNANVTVVQNTAAPVTSVATSNSQICPGESVTLTASGGATYIWTGLPGTGNTQTVSPAVTTAYTVTAVGANGCVSAQPATITVIVGPPTPFLTASKTKICVGESVTLTATGGVTYNWGTLPGNGSTQIVSPTVTTTYQVIALGGNGCTTNIPATITIEVVPAIVSTLKDVYVCAGDTGILDAGSGPNYTYVWSNGATTQTISTNIPGTYSVTISNGTCSRDYTAQLLNPQLPQFTNISFSDHILTVTATNPNNTVLEYSIDNGVTWQTSNIFYSVENNMSYNIRIRNKDADCSNFIEFYTFVVINAITPNRDGINEGVDFSGISKYNNFAASVFDRYGAEIYKASKSGLKWDGTLRGMNIPSGTYWYKVQWENPASKKMEIRNGWILVKNRN